MSQEIAPGIPSNPQGSSVGSSAAFAVKMNSSGRVNFAIDVATSGLSAKGWSVEGIKPNTHFTIDLPISRFKVGLGSMVIFNFGGYAFQFFDEITESDPTNTFLPTYGSYVVGLPTTAASSQNQLVQQLADAMHDVVFISAKGFFSFEVSGIDPILDTGTDLDGVFSRLLITVIRADALIHGPYTNDFAFTGNVLGGGVFTGPTKGAGWELTSRQANDGDTQVSIALTNGETSNFQIEAKFLNGLRTDISTALAPVILDKHLMFKRDNYVMFFGTWHFAIFPTSYNFVPIDSEQETEFGTSDYWLCMPKVPNRQRYPVYGLDSMDSGITYAAFEVVSPSFTLNAAKGAFCVADMFVKGNLAALDVGMSILPVNSQGIQEGALTTTTLLPLLYTPFVAISPGSTLFDREHHIPYVLQPLSIVGFIADAIMLSMYAKPGTKMYYAGYTMVCYRSQAAPCECSLWYLIT